MENNLFDLNKKTYLVTGASSGIGREVCTTINKFNGNFIAVARREEELKELVNSTGNPGNSYIVADLRNDADLKNIVATMPNIDGIVHSAGIVKLAPIKFYSQELMDDIRLTNYDSIVKLMSGILKNRKLNKKSSIVLISSLSGLHGFKANGIYAGMKGALIAISKVWASELAPQGIRVNCVAPGMVNTVISQAFSDETSSELAEIDRKKYPLGYGEPYQVAYPILFLLSEASNWITSQTLILDGGRTMAQ